MESFLLNITSIAPTVGTKPLSFGFSCEGNTGEVKPFDLTVAVIATNHFPEGDLIAQAVGRLIRVYGRPFVYGGRSVAQQNTITISV